MPGRQYTAVSHYRYGFNGKEQDSAIDGTGVDYDYGARVYDARVGRWFSMDPLWKKYPYETPYIFGGGNAIYMVDNGGQTKTTFFATIDDRTGKTTVTQQHTNELFKKRIEVASSAFGIDTHDVTYKYEWYDITTLVVTHINKNGNATTATRTNNYAKLRATTTYDWGGVYAVSGFWASAFHQVGKLKNLFPHAKEKPVQDGYIEMSKNGQGGDGYNKSSVRISGIIDIDLLVDAIDAAKFQSSLEPSEPEPMWQAANIAESIKHLAEALEMAKAISDNNGSNDNNNSKKGVVAHCTYCNSNFKDSANQWVPTDKPATDTMDGVFENHPVDQTPLKKRNN